MKNIIQRPIVFEVATIGIQIPYHLTTCKHFIVEIFIPHQKACGMGIQLARVIVTTSVTLYNLQK